MEVKLKNVDFIKKEINKQDIDSYILNLKKFDEDTFYHSFRVCNLSIELGKKINLDENQLEILTISSLLHDIGKILIDINILNKPEKLTKKEYNNIKLHCLIGYNYLKIREDIPEEIRINILFHHENENGTGYCFKLKEEDIPLCSKIIHICDNYDAITSKRCYKEAQSKEYAFDFLFKNKDIMFNSELVDTFSNII